MSTNIKAFIMFQLSPLDIVLGGILPVEFLNPEEISISHNNKITSAARNPNANQFFDRVTQDDFSTTLFIDSTESAFPAIDNARTKVLAMRAALMYPTLFKGNGTRVPPRCRFVWGTFIIEGYCTKMTEKYSYFSPLGIPLRAEVDITIKPTQNFLEALIFGNSTNSRKFWTVKSGDRLDLIARQMYNDPSLWRPIAEANDIRKPLDFPLPEDIGRQLIIPDELGLVGA